MDVTALMHNLKEEVTCSVCMQLYTKPKQLPCLHIFCLQCLNNLARTSAHHGVIRCPLCQREVAVPETGTLETLPNCFHMKNLLDILAIRECNTAKITCGNCEKKSEEACYCFHCGRFWCNDCVNAHNILRENREHRVLALKDFEDKDFEDVLKQPVFCQEELHDKEILKFYCKECDIPVCQTCVIVEHNKHDVEHLEVAARKVKRDVTTKLNAARESSNRISCEYIGEKEEKSRLIEYSSHSNKERIRQTTKSLISILQQKEQELIAEVENQRKLAQEELKKSTDGFQDFLNKREQSISNIEALVQRSTGAELATRGTRATIEELFQELENMSFMTGKKVKSTLFAKNEEISKVLEESVIGHLEQSATEANKSLVHGFQEATAGLETEIEVITRNSEGEQCYCAGDSITLRLISAQQDTEQDEEQECIALLGKIVDRKNGSYSVPFIPSKSGQYVLAVQINGENISRFPPFEIKERYFKPLSFIGEGIIEGLKLHRPWGVTVNDSDEIFVSDMINNRILVFNENGQFIRSLGQNILKCPNGIVCDHLGRIFVGNRDDNKILVLGQNGKHVSTFHGDESLNEPRGISFDAKGNLIVCDTENECVRFFSPDGNMFKTIGSSWLRQPFNCVCHKDKIFVSDCDAHLVKVYNSSGRFLYEFGTYGTRDGGLNEPTGLAVDKTGHLLVCCFGNHRVDVFTLDGKFVAKFGEYGRDLGQLAGPTSVSVLKNGHIVVCEFQNNRLQIFK